MFGRTNIRPVKNGLNALIENTNTVISVAWYLTDIGEPMGFYKVNKMYVYVHKTSGINNKQNKTVNKKAEVGRKGGEHRESEKVEREGAKGERGGGVREGVREWG